MVSFILFLRKTKTFRKLLTTKRLYCCARYSRADWPGLNQSAALQLQDIRQVTAHLPPMKGISTTCLPTLLRTVNDLMQINHPENPDTKASINGHCYCYCFKEKGKRETVEIAERFSLHELNSKRLSKHAEEESWKILVCRGFSTLHRNLKQILMHSP